MGWVGRRKNYIQGKTQHHKWSMDSPSHAARIKSMDFRLLVPDWFSPRVSHLLGVKPCPQKSSLWMLSECTVLLLFSEPVIYDVTFSISMFYN